ncbi:TetR/AcrR family transcriptional regulator [Lactobacillus acetotolerans]|jgi:AcrR family transcriptional regulator|uniref:TetR/AcrR family transcriptional regulator n=1 Tax=Lactobacillus acetotolerans TaxID=1600 RepID=UPI000E82AB10|nr:TetR/AcrR family transcriptional regulator [Lactobacillus acetotolerans]HBG91124.1 TetR/AcrR family transcriptional regulator [Lactobacillus acetotolerans]
MKNTENELITKAIKAIDKNGYQNLSLRKLTQSIGLTTGAFYKHFENKNILYAKVTSEISKEFIDHAKIDNNLPAQEQILQIADYFVKQIKIHPNIMNFLFFNEEAVSALTKDSASYPFLKKIRTLIEQLNLKSGVSKQDFFIQIWSFIQGYAFLIKNGVIDYNPALVQTTLKQLINGES